MSFFGKLFGKKEKESLDQGLQKTKEGFLSKITKAIAGKSAVGRPGAILGPEAGKLAQFWLEHSLPSMNAFPSYAEAGGLMSYGAVNTEVSAMMGGQVAKILDGARPSDVPVQRATQFHLVINLKTAKALGITVPQSLFVRADRVIE